jgi:methionine-rich copper-binding protein CopC
MWNRRSLSAWIASGVLAIGTAAALHAHAVLVASSPAAHSSVKGPDVVIELRFNARIDAARSNLTISGPDRKVRPLEITAQDPGKPALLNTTAHGLAPGAYQLRWQVLAADGHITRGQVPFTVE